MYLIYSDWLRTMIHIHCCNYIVQRYILIDVYLLLLPQWSLCNVHSGVLNVLVLISHHSHVLGYSALLIVHLILFQVFNKYKAQMRPLPKMDSILLCFLQTYKMGSLSFLPSFTLYFVTCSPELGERKAKDPICVSIIFFPFTHIMNIHKYFTRYFKPIQSPYL